MSFPHGEPSVRCPVPVAGGGDASVSMEPEGVTMASSLSAAVYVDSQVSTNYEPSVRCGAVNYCKLYHYADGAVSMDQPPSMSREPSVFLVSMASSLSATIYEVTISRYP